MQGLRGGFPRAGRRGSRGHSRLRGLDRGSRGQVESITPNSEGEYDLAEPLDPGPDTPPPIGAGAANGIPARPGRAATITGAPAAARPPPRRHRLPPPAFPRLSGQDPGTRRVPGPPGMGLLGPLPADLEGRPGAVRQPGRRPQRPRLGLGLAVLGGPRACLPGLSCRPGRGDPPALPDPLEADQRVRGHGPGATRRPANPATFEAGQGAVARASTVLEAAGNTAIRCRSSIPPRRPPSSRTSTRASVPRRPAWCARSGSSSRHPASRGISRSSRPRSPRPPPRWTAIFPGWTPGRRWSWSSTISNIAASRRPSRRGSRSSSTTWAAAAWGGRSRRARPS